MLCPTCPSFRQEHCRQEGCSATQAVAYEALAAQPVAEAIDRQLTRLDVECGDILVVRTRQKLQPDMVAKWQAELQDLCRGQGVRDIAVVVLDNCTDLTIERPKAPDTRMQYQPVKGAPIVSY